MPETGCPACKRGLVQVVDAEIDLRRIARMCARARYGQPSPRALAKLADAKAHLAQQRRFYDEHIAAEHEGRSLT